MKTHSTPRLRRDDVPSDSASLSCASSVSRRATASSSPPQAPIDAVALAFAQLPPEDDVDFEVVPPPAGCVRLLLGLEVPAAALTQIAADWSLITSAQQSAPEAVPELRQAALQRLTGLR